jgi:superfamily II DNA or RNA helicase
MTTIIPKKAYYYYKLEYKPILKSTYPNESPEQILTHLKEYWEKIKSQKTDEYLKFKKMSNNSIEQINQIIQIEQKIEPPPACNLSRKGYIIDKSQFSASDLAKFKRDLTVTPKVVPGYGDEPETFCIFRETASTLEMPRYFGLNNVRNIPHEIAAGVPISVPFVGSLRDYQIEIIAAFKAAFAKQRGGILAVGCGWGKTVCGLYLSHLVGQKTLIIVHKTTLADQWIERIQEYMPSARVGRIQAKTVDVENKDIVIAMLQSLCVKKYDKSIFSPFGMLIVDECHHIGSKVFSQALSKVQCEYTIGLSATPARKDGLSKVFNWFLGDIVFQSEKPSAFSVTVKALYYKSAWYQEMRNFKGAYNFAGMINQIANELPRTEKIVYLAIKAAQEGRQVLIISGRIKHIKLLKKMVDDYKASKPAIDFAGKLLPNKNTGDVIPITCGLYIGSIKKTEIDASSKKDILIGSYPMISEGTDIPTLSMIILATPMGDVEQSVGRILRKQNMHDPYIIDIIDEFSIFPGQSQKRMKLYKKKGFLLKGYNNKTTNAHKTINDEDREFSEKINKTCLL